MIPESEMHMRGRLLANLLLIPVAGLLVAGSEAAASHNNQDSSASRFQDVSFTLTQLPENPRKYSLAVSDTDERGISGSFSVDQLQILRAIMTEADKFALSGEAVGTNEPITTRFMDKQETAFIVDVQKAGNQSMLFLTLKTEIGRMTMEAGRVIRTTRREEGFFFDLLSRLESVLAKPPARPGK
jgi:hypothetical protein